jgi:polyisoprenoid-binding protein YceI
MKTTIKTMRRLPLLTLITLAVSLPAMGVPFKVGTGNVEFKAKGFPTFITITGKSNSVAGTLDFNPETKKASGSFNLPLATLKTGMDLRDEHMTEKYLEVKKFPNATLTLKPFTLKEEGEAMGTLKLHDVEKEVTIKYTSNTSDDAIKVNTEFDIVLSQFNIDIPSFQGITVAKDIKLKVDLMARKQ